MKRKLLSLALALGLSISILATSVSAAEMPFQDVNPNDWFYGAVEHVYENDIMHGFDPATFAPNINITRGMFATVLYRWTNPVLDVVPVNPFSDVADGIYYHDPIAWAADGGIIHGYGDGRFGPDDNLTREQMVTILYRYAKLLGNVDVGEDNHQAITSFTDGDQISSWALPAINWALSEAIIQGIGNKMLAPKSFATRAQVAQLIFKFSSSLQQPMYM